MNVCGCRQSNSLLKDLSVESRFLYLKTLCVTEAQEEAEAQKGWGKSNRLRSATLVLEKKLHSNGRVDGLSEGAAQEDGGGAGDASCSSHGAR